MDVCTKKEGVIGLWAGNGANLLRVFPAKAIVFSTNDMYKSLLCRLLLTTGGGSNDSDHSSSASGSASSGTISFFSGGLAGMTASAITYPLDFARGRISGKLAGSSTSSNSSGATTGTAQSSSAAAAAPSAAGGSKGQQRPTKVYTGIMQTIAITIKDEGFLALYKGITPTLLGAMPYEGIKFGTVGILESLFPTRNDQPPSYYITRKMIMGGMGGVMAGLITYPNDTIRRMLQLQGSRGTNSQYSGYFDCAVKTYQEHGITRFYRGLLVNTIRMFPNVMIQFGSYELLKRWTADWF